MGFHEHANVAGLLVLRRDRLIAIRTHLLSIKVIDHYRLAFLLFVHFTVYRLSGDFWHFLGWLENARLGKFRCGLTCKWSLLRLDWLDYWLLDWLMHRLLDRLHHWLHHWLVDRLVNRLLHRLHDWLLHRLTLFRNPCINISCERPEQSKQILKRLKCSGLIRLRLRIRIFLKLNKCLNKTTVACVHLSASAYVFDETLGFYVGST